MFYLIAIPLFDIVYKNVCMKVLAFNVEEEYYCYLAEKSVANIDQIIWQCFDPKCRLLL